MKVILSYCLKDYNLAWYAASVMLAHTDMKPENLVLYASSKAPTPPKQFKGIAAIQCDDDTMTHPQGPNIMVASLFKEVARGTTFEEVTMERFLSDEFIGQMLIVAKADYAHNS